MDISDYDKSIITSLQAKVDDLRQQQQVRAELRETDVEQWETTKYADHRIQNALEAAEKELAAAIRRATLPRDRAVTIYLNEDEYKVLLEAAGGDESRISHVAHEMLINEW